MSSFKIKRSRLLSGCISDNKKEPGSTIPLGSPMDCPKTGSSNQQNAINTPVKNKPTTSKSCKYGNVFCNCLYRSGKQITFSLDGYSTMHEQEQRKEDPTLPAQPVVKESALSFTQNPPLQPSSLGVIQEFHGSQLSLSLPTPEIQDLRLENPKRIRAQQTELNANSGHTETADTINYSISRQFIFNFNFRSPRTLSVYCEKSIYGQGVVHDANEIEIEKKKKNNGNLITSKESKINNTRSGGIEDIIVSPLIVPLSPFKAQSLTSDDIENNLKAYVILRPQILDSKTSEYDQNVGHDAHEVDANKIKNGNLLMANETAGRYSGEFLINEVPKSLRQPQPPKRNENMRLSSPKKIPVSYSNLPKKFIENVQNAMKKKWQMAVKCKQESTTRQREVFGFREYRLDENYKDTSVSKWVQRHYCSDVVECSKRNIKSFPPVPPLRSDSLPKNTPQEHS